MRKSKDLLTAIRKFVEIFGHETADRMLVGMMVVPRGYDELKFAIDQMIYD